jgi:hypothetical protein
MSFSVQELDNTVRAFYEGKGDVVSIHRSGHLRAAKRVKTERTRADIIFLSSKNEHNNL